MTITWKKIQGYYKQKKKKKKKKNNNNKKRSKNRSLTRTPFDHQDDFDKEERVLRRFDMNMTYGPCFGITRLARWERAQKLGLNPPREIQDLLKDGKVKLESLLDGRTI